LDGVVCQMGEKTAGVEGKFLSWKTDVAFPKEEKLFVVV
jgi:hypothetical protein